MQNPDDNYLFERDGKFWFWDETWSNEYGPFSCRKEAQLEYKIYCDTTLEGKEITLDQRLSRAKYHVLTPREIWQQRISFVYGNLMDNSNVTREMVEATAIKEYGPCPEE